MGDALGLIGSALAGGLKGLGDAGAFIGKQQMEHDYEREKMKMREEMELRIDEIKRGRNLADEDTRFERDLQRLPRKVEAEMAAKETIAPRENKLAAQRKIDVDNNEDVAKAESKRAGIIAEGKAESERKATIAQGSDSEFLKAKRAIKSAEESSASAAQAALARFQLDRAKIASSAQDDLVKAEKSGDQTAVESARKVLSALNSKGENPKDAATLMSMARGYLAAADKTMDEQVAADYRQQAKMFSDLAIKEMGNSTIPKEQKALFPPKSGAGKPADGMMNTQKASAGNSAEYGANMDYHILIKNDEALAERFDALTSQLSKPSATGGRREQIQNELVDIAKKRNSLKKYIEERKGK